MMATPAISARILEQLHEVRLTGEVNMHYMSGVQRVAYDHEHYALVSFIEDLQKSPHRFDGETYMKALRMMGYKYHEEAAHAVHGGGSGWIDLDVGGYIWIPTGADRHIHDDPNDEEYG